MSAVVIGHANVRNRMRAVDELLAAGCHSAGLNEADQLVRELVKLDRYRTVVIDGHGGRRGQETPTLVRRSLPALGSLTLQVSEPSTPRRVAPARILSAALYRHPIGQVAHVNVHLNYVGAGAARGLAVDRVREYDESARSLGRVVRFLRGEGFRTVVTGDVNVPAGQVSPGWSTAQEVLQRAGLTVRMVGRLDLVAWDAETLALRQLDAVPAAQLGSDHPGAIAKLGKP